MKPTVLVVDDDADIRTTVRLSLESGFDIEEADDGQTAIEMLTDRPQHFQAMVLDLMMPRKSGFDVLEHVRDVPALQRLPIVILTARTDREAKLDAFVGGGHVFLSKPFDPGMLLGTIKDLITRSDTGRNADRLGRLMNLAQE